MSTIQFPIVTLTDLENFKANHFPSTSKHPNPSDPSLQLNPSNPPSQPYNSDHSKQSHLSNPDHEAGKNSEVSEEEDELGYYPDGVKRTLTEEQIKMFRDSEIYGVRRRRQVDMENAISDRNYSADNGGDDEEIEVVHHNDTEDIEDPEHASLPGTHIHTLNEGTRKRRELYSGDSQTELYDGNRKESGGIRTARGQVRELDDVVDDVEDLDYGEETTMKVEKPAMKTTENKRTDDAALGGTLDLSANGNEGTRKHCRKIWWPAIG